MPSFTDTAILSPGYRDSSAGRIQSPTWMAPSAGNFQIHHLQVVLYVNYTGDARRHKFGMVLLEAGLDPALEINPGITCRDFHVEARAIRIAQQRAGDLPAQHGVVRQVFRPNSDVVCHLRHSGCVLCDFLGC